MTAGSGSRVKVRVSGSRFGFQFFGSDSWFGFEFSVRVSGLLFKFTNVKQHASHVKQHASTVKQHASKVKQHASKVKQHAHARGGQWCGHCKKLAPTWGLLASHFVQDSSVAIANVDCTVHKGVCEKQVRTGEKNLAGRDCNLAPRDPRASDPDPDPDPDPGP